VAPTAPAGAVTAPGSPPPGRHGGGLTHLRQSTTSDISPGEARLWVRHSAHSLSRHSHRRAPPGRHSPSGRPSFAESFVQPTKAGGQRIPPPCRLPNSSCWSVSEERGHPPSELDTVSDEAQVDIGRQGPILPHPPQLPYRAGLGRVFGRYSLDRLEAPLASAVCSSSTRGH